MNIFIISFINILFEYLFNKIKFIFIFYLFIYYNKNKLE